MLPTPSGEGAPGWCEALSCITMLCLSPLLGIGGEMSCEFFGGNTIIYMGLHFAEVPRFHPFDFKYDKKFDLFSRFQTFVELITAGILV